MPQRLAVQFEGDPSAHDLERVERGLTEHAAAAGIEPRDERPLRVLVRDESGEIVAGLVGRTVWGWLHIAQLWVDSSRRRHGYGRELMMAAEAEARRRGCHHIYLDTFDFQALEFYRRLGYRIFGRLDDFPRGHTRFNLEKSLATDARREPDDNAAFRFPVSVKGVIIREDRVVLLRNERDEWELPGGKLEPGESPAQCVGREIAEELSLDVTVAEILDSWVYEITPAVCVLIVTYGCVERAERAAVRSHEHKELAWMPLQDLASVRMPDGYKQSIRRWAESRRNEL